MRKQFKKALSMVLSAAMVLTLGSGFELKSAKAADAEEWVDTAYTAAKLEFTYTQTGDELGSPVYNGGESNETAVTAGKNTVNAYPKMAGAWNGNVGWIKNATAGASYKVTDIVLTLTTAAGDVAIDIADQTSAPSEDGKQPNNVDFPNIWDVGGADGVGEVVLTASNGNARLVCIAGPTLGLQVKPAADETEAPATSGDATSAPATSGDATAAPTASGNATETPTQAPTEAPTQAPTAEPTEIPADPGKYQSLINYADNDWAVQYWGESAEETDVVATNAEVTGPGKYTVGLDFSQTAAGVGNGITFVDVEIKDLAEYYHSDRYIRVDEIKINGTAVPEALLSKVYTCSDNKVDTRVNLYNGWCSEDDAYAVDEETGEPKRKEARALGDIKEATPWLLEDYIDEEISSIEVSYTYGTKEEIHEIDNPTVESPSPAPSTNPTQNPGTNPTQKPGTNPTQAPNGGTGTGTVAKGTTAKVGTANYKVTGATTAEYSGSTQKNPTSITVPATVKIKGKSFKVTSIKAKAFANKKKLKSVTVGKNIKTIGKQAFFKCPKLNKITFKGTAVTKIGAKAFAKGAKKPTVTTPKKMKKKALNSFKKKMKKAGLSKKAKYKKK